MVIAVVNMTRRLAMTNGGTMTFVIVDALPERYAVMGFAAKKREQDDKTRYRPVLSPWPKLVEVSAG